MILSRPKIIRLSAWLLLLAVFLFGLSAVRAQVSSNASVEELNAQIQQKKNELDKIQQQQQNYQAQIKAKADQRVTLSNQLSILSDQISQAKLDIESVQIKIQQNSLQTQKINYNIGQLNQQINNDQAHLSDLLNTLYKRDQNTELEALLLNNSLSDFLNQIKYLSDTGKNLNATVSKLEQKKSLLEIDQASAKQTEDKLKQLKSDLEQKQSDLTYEQQSKQDLLKETNNSEQRYQSLLQQGIEQQRQAENDISTAEKLVRQKLSTQQQSALDTNNTMIWPVPSRQVTMGFHDPSYPFRKLIGEHSGVDIRAPQGTIIRAAADGYVGTVHFDGTKNYAYIMLIHGHGLSTLYGHVSAVYVTTDQYVTQGEPIGRTGGTPGSIGAGPFTTGPHLHFEVRLNGLPVNPMNYLP